MALYIPAGRRRRRVIITGAVALVIGLVLGWGIGRLSVNAQGQADAAKQSAAKVVGALRAQPIHYGQAQRGEIDKAGYLVSLNDALNLAGNDLTTALDQAIWINSSTAEQLRARMAALRALADRNAPPDEYEQATNEAVDAINNAFGTS